ncbi:MAG: chemotaxis protein CheB [Polyangiaceae bacterium]
MSTDLPFRIIAIGASAGGLEALEKFFETAPAAVNAAFLVVQHLSPDHKSLMADILGKRTRLAVTEATEGQLVQRGCVYVIPARSNLTISGQRLKLVERARAHAINMPIDLLFRSLADQHGENAVGVVLSGTGSDGRAGVDAIKEAGGLVVVQDPASAKFDGMPRSAISTGLADYVLAPEEMLPTILKFIDGPADSHLLDNPETSTDTMRRVYEQLRRVTQVDFSEYKIATVARRIERRMGLLGLRDLSEYARRLENDVGESVAVGKELLISVTRFFRDEEAWASLVSSALDDALLHASSSEGFRAWVVGCATGQEAYTLGMLITERMSALGREIPFRIFATDLDRNALELASAGVYPTSLISDVSSERLDRFFEREGDSWTVRRELRRHILFAAHNVTRDPPFTRLDLVTCRNVLIYLGANLQTRVLSGFAFGLRKSGYLLLGPSETLGEATDRFRTVDGQWKIFQRNAALSNTSISPALIASSPPLKVSNTPSEDQQANELALRILTEKIAPTSVLVREDLQLVSVFGNAGQLLRVPIGSATLSLSTMLPEGLRTIAQIACTRALATGDEQLFAAREPPGVTAVRVRPISLGRSSKRFLLVVFSGEQPSESPTAVPPSEHEELEDLQRELQNVRESLQATIEELETSNEELQATNEEMLAANEELQSTNEELQSTNEELLSLNEELNTVNAEHQARIQDLSNANADLDSIFTSSAIGLLLLDSELRIRRFTQPLTQYLNILERDIGRPIEHLSMRVDQAEFLSLLHAVRTSGKVLDRELGAAEGTRFRLRVAPYERHGTYPKGIVVSIADVTELRRSESDQKMLQRVLDSLQEQVAVIDERGVITMVNAAWRRNASAYRADDRTTAGVGVNYLDASKSEQAVVDGLSAVLRGQQASFDFEYPCHGPDGPAWFLLHCRALVDAKGAVVSHINITAQRKLSQLNTSAS